MSLTNAWIVPDCDIALDWLAASSIAVDPQLRSLRCWTCGAWHRSLHVSADRSRLVKVAWTSCRWAADGPSQRVVQAATANTIVSVYRANHAGWRLLCFEWLVILDALDRAILLLWSYWTCRQLLILSTAERSFVTSYSIRHTVLHHHHHLFAQNTIKIDNGYVNEQDRKAHCALTSAHNITSTVERNTHNTIHGIGVTRNR